MQKLLLEKKVLTLEILWYMICNRILLKWSTKRLKKKSSNNILIKSKNARFGNQMEQVLSLGNWNFKDWFICFKEGNEISLLQSTYHLSSRWLINLSRKLTKFFLIIVWHLHKTKERRHEQQLEVIPPLKWLKAWIMHSHPFRINAVLV